MITNINNLKECILQNSTFASEKTIDIVVDDLKNVLIENNFDLNNIYVEVGETSLNFINDNIVIRLTYIRYDNWGYNTISDYVSHSSVILKPEFEKKVNTGDANYPTILGLKKLIIGTVTKKERDEVYIKLREDGYLFNDAGKLENFGKDENGNVYLIDYGELIYIKDEEKMNNPELFYRTQYEKFVERELKYHINYCSKLNNIYEKSKGINKKTKLIAIRNMILKLKEKKGLKKR